MIPRIAILGASGHGIAALDAAQRQGLEVVGFLDSFKPAGSPAGPLKVLGHPDDTSRLIREHRFSGVFLGVSNNFTRRAVWEALHAAAPELELISVIHPGAIVAASARIGVGSLLMAGAVVNAGCVIGANCIVNTNASLDHDSEMKPYASILPGVTTGGGVNIGECSCVCLGATISHRVMIGDHTVVGAGAVVLRDLPRGCLAYGVPARVVRNRQPDERHF